MKTKANAAKRMKINKLYAFLFEKQKKMCVHLICWEDFDLLGDGLWLLNVDLSVIVFAWACVITSTGFSGNNP